jgi:hypothetical protein
MPDGLNRNCKACAREYAKRWRAENPEKAKEIAQAWWERHKADPAERRRRKEYKRRRMEDPEFRKRIHQRKQKRRTHRFKTDPEYRAKCKAKRNAHSARTRLRALYGISSEKYAQMLAAQEGGCAICGSPSRDRTGGRLVVDHDHATGRVRGLLCSCCNLGIGLLDDDTNRMLRLIGYLERHRNRLQRLVQHIEKLRTAANE